LTIDITVIKKLQLQDFGTTKTLSFLNTIQLSRKENKIISNLPTLFIVSILPITMALLNCATGCWQKVFYCWLC